MLTDEEINALNKLPATEKLPADTEVNWIDWNGGSNPIKDGQKFAIKFRDHALFEAFNGKELHVDVSAVADFLDWEHHDDVRRGNDIVAYAIVEG